jgi:phosphoglycerate dehydrogenase-like enzyme
VTTICVPDDEAVELIGPLPDGLDVVTWSGSGPAPPGVEFWVPSFEFGRAAAISRLPDLRVVQLVSAGVDGWIEHMPAGTLLCDARGVHGGSTAEWVLTAILSVLREFPRFLRATGERRWQPAVTDEMAGKRVVVVGAGDLGENVARRVRAFDAEPVLVARTGRHGVHAVADLPALLPTADVVVLVVPLTDQTRGLVDEAFLAAMADGALLVNAARGAVVVTDALIAQLRSGRLRAALDVVAPEPPPPDHPIWDAPNLLLTPHVGGAVRGFPARVYGLVREQVERYAAGAPLLNVVRDGY